MYTMMEMEEWDYATAWEFFTNNAVNRYIPETDLYVRSMSVIPTFDLRDDLNAREKILEAVKAKSLILMDGSSLNGKSTFAKRLARIIDAEIVDIDLICKDWIDEQTRNKNDIEKFLFLLKSNELTDIYILENLERIIKGKSSKSVILVGSYLEVIYRSIIAKTLGQYFEQTVSIYCCAKSFEDIKMMHKKREMEYGIVPVMLERNFQEYKYSQRLLEYNGFWLGYGMTRSFIADINVSDMFVVS